MLDRGLKIEENRLLKPLTTFKIGGPARYFISVTQIADVTPALDFAKSRSLPVLILGGGSNMLISDAGYPGVVIHIENRDITLDNEDEDSVLLRVSSGEVWDDVVKFAVEREYWGVENLSRIPGQAGSVPVQNVGAYGVEAKDVVVSVEVFDRVDNSVKMILSEDCGFAYRTSIFNTTHKGRYIILSMMLKLSKLPNPKLGYPDVIKRFDIHAHPSLNEIRQAIIEIRDGKFPFPAESIEGNAGSFFKNPLLTEHEFLALEKMFEQNTPNALDKLRSIRNRFPLADGVKIPGAFILEACELKGFAFGQAMLNPAQPVVVLNKTGNARALDVLSLVREVRRIVRERTGLHLITEPELIGFSETELRYYGFNEVEIERYIHQPT